MLRALNNDFKGGDQLMPDNNDLNIDHFKDDNKPSTYSANGVNVSLNLNKIFEYFFLNHFYFSSCLLMFLVFSYLVIGGYINIPNILLRSDIFITGHYFHFMIAAIAIAILIFIIVCYNISKRLLRSHEINKVFSEALVNQFNALKNELIDLKNILQTLQNNYNSVTISIGTLTQLISDDVLNTKKIVNILNNINSTIKKIPNKDTIIDILTIRTKLLFTDTIEVVAEYLTYIIARQPLTTVGNGNPNIFNVNVNQVNNNKNAFIEEKLQHKIDEIKTQYINEVYHLSKNTVDNKIKPDIENLLKQAFDNVIYLTLNPEQQNTLDQLLYNIDHCIKQLTANLINLYADNLLLTSFFDES